LGATVHLQGLTAGCGCFGQKLEENYQLLLRINQLVASSNSKSGPGAEEYQRWAATAHL
jgi:hypothetical protein